MERLLALVTKAAETEGLALLVGTALVAAAISWGAARLVRSAPELRDQALREMAPQGPAVEAARTDAAAGALPGRAAEPPAAAVEPEHLLCPVLQALMRDPVFVVDSGNTYERDAVLEYWARVGEPRDPLTNARLPTADVRTNWDVRRQVQGFLDAHPAHAPEGWAGSRELLPPDRPPPEPPARDEPPQEQAPLDADGLPAGVAAHCQAVAQSHGGFLPEELLQHLAATLGADAEVLRRRFPAPPAPARAPDAQEAPPAGGDAAAVAQQALPDGVRRHCEAMRAHYAGGLPEAVLEHLAGMFGVEQASLRAAYGGP